MHVISLSCSRLLPPSTCSSSLEVAIHSLIRLAQLGSLPPDETKTCHNALQTSKELAWTSYLHL
ncbi:hypothetical protein Mapa_006186 [Marchantia paleacea]|nr:hypothetical protein Mapa_006186 [Marchantia paleacea]